jgi:FkbM family methyltransferase
VFELTDSIVKYQEEVGAPRAGCLTEGPLKRIEWYFQTYFRGKPVRTVETGCGASTIMFARYAEQHTAYCTDDRESSNSNVLYAQGFPGFHRERVNWIYGPPQRTIFARPLERPVDVLLIDGPHGYPFPELEYFGLYSCLQPGSILIVDDIHIPTINNFYQFLLQDDSFRPHGLVVTTAYFQRTDTPPFNMEADDWWLQRYNAQHFPIRQVNYDDAGVRLPITLVFDRHVASRAPALTRGFSVLDSPPVSEGLISTVELRLARQIPALVRIELDIEPVCVPERQESGVTVLANGREVGSWAFELPGRRKLEVEAPIDETDILALEFWNHGLRPANELNEWVKPAAFDARLPNFRLYSISLSDSTAPTNPTILHRADGCISTFDYAGQQFSFFVDRDDDSVQIFHTLGRFYELDELELLRGYVSPDMSILDVGAHVGNHTVYFAKVMGAQRVVPIEPNPRAQFLLRTNCALNDVRTVELAYLDRALGDRTATASLVTADWFNSGGTTVRLDGGPVSVYRGDDLFAAEWFDLVKIDVEGRELDVLAGLADTIARCRPLMFIEVNDDHRSQFLALVEQWSYEIEWQAQMYPQITNFLLKPRSPAR